MSRATVLLLVLFAIGCRPSHQSVEDSRLLNAPLPTANRDTYSTYRQKVQAELDYYFQRHNSHDAGYEMMSRYAAEGDTTLYSYCPTGRLTLRSMRSPRHGKGLMRDRQGRLIVGEFLSDTLVSGLRFDSLGFYAGQMNALGEASGQGAYHAFDDTYAAGHWHHDQLEGLAFSLSPTLLKAGVWQYGLFRGEQMNYHADRIYGIDISRHQHEKYRRHLPFSWNNLRITHLGHRINQQLVLDKVDYPVSFVFIKSTEGTTIENRYYDSDYQSAHDRHIAVGSYHFFSTKTPASEQARHFLSHSHFQKGDLPPMLDIEPSDKQIEQMGGPLVLFNEMRTWLQMVEHATHTRPLIYINQNFSLTYLTMAPDLKENYPLWIARYGEYKPHHHMTFWQLSADGRVSGITGDVDLNVFNGYQHHWEQFLRESTIK